jgi:hypothetical protein
MNPENYEDDYKMDMLDMAADDHAELVASMDEDEGTPFAEEDCPLDGDAESALASIGWGTDEDYGCFDGGGDAW